MGVEGKEFLVEEQRRCLSSKLKLNLNGTFFSFTLPSGVEMALIFSQLLPHSIFPLPSSSSSNLISLFLCLLVSFLPLPCPQGNKQASQPPGFRLQTKNCSNNRPEKKEIQVSTLNWPGPQWRFWRLMLLETQCALVPTFSLCFICIHTRTHTQIRYNKNENISLKMFTG